MSVRPAQMIYQKTHIKPNPNLKRGFNDDAGSYLSSSSSNSLVLRQLVSPKVSLFILY